MKKSTKGAIATGAAAVLLMGGAGTLAYWNAEGDVSSGTITAGTLNLDQLDAGTWTLNGAAVTSPGSVLIVPGDELVFTGSWTIDATGDNLQATVGFSGLADTQTPAGKLTVTPSWTVDGTTVANGATVTEDNDGDVLKATVAVDFPFGATVDNDSQGMTLDLSDGAVTLTQTDATP